MIVIVNSISISISISVSLQETKKPWSNVFGWFLTHLSTESHLEHQFVFMKLTMARWTIIYGGSLIGWAASISIITGSESITSWIPAMLGVPMLLMGLMYLIRPAQRKIWMHIAALLGVIAFLGGLDFFRGPAAGRDLFTSPAASASKLMLLVSGACFVAMCLRSFVWARKNSQD